MRRMGTRGETMTTTVTNHGETTVEYAGVRIRPGETKDISPEVVQVKLTEPAPAPEKPTKTRAKQ